MDNVKLLLEKGADVITYDPVAADHFMERFPEGKMGKGSIAYADAPEKALRGANICFIFTEWAEIKQVSPQKYVQLMQTPLVYDGRNIYDPEDMKVSGVEYYSIGR